jgi:hypothetical protein
VKSYDGRTAPGPVAKGKGEFSAVTGDMPSGLPGNSERDLILPGWIHCIRFEQPSWRLRPTYCAGSVSLGRNAVRISGFSVLPAMLRGNSS